MKHSPSRTRVLARQEAVTWGARLHPWVVGCAMALFVARLLWPSESVAWRGDGLPLAFLWLVLAGAWLTAGLLDGHLEWRFSWVDVAFAALVSWHSIAAVWSAAHDAPRPAVNLLWEWVALACAFGIVRQCIATPRETRAVIAVMMAVAGAIGLLGLNEYFITMPATRGAFENNPDAALAQSGMWFPAGSVERQLFEQRLYSHEPAGTFGLANSLAGFLATWLIVVAGIAFAAPKNESRRRVWLTAAATALPAAVCLTLTKSRSAYAALALGIVMLALAAGRFRRLDWKLPVAALAIAIVAVVVGVLSGTLDREILTEAPKSLGYRGQYWRATWAMIAEHPWLGSGPGNFGDHYTRFKLPTASEEIADPHNCFLEVWATAGTPALIAFVLVLGLTFWHAWRVPTTYQALPNRLEASRSRDGGNAILLGGAAGFFGALLIPIVAGPLIYAPTSPGLLVVAVVAASMLGWLWRPWVDEGTLPATLPALAVAVLVVNLLAAGGIGFPAVAGTLWLLVALSLNQTLPAGFSEWRVRWATPARLLVAWCGSLGVIAACYFTGYRCVVVAQTEIAMAHHEPRRAEELLLQAAAADRFAAEPWAELTALRFARWRAQPTNEHFAAFETAQAETLRRRPSQSRLRLQMAEYYLEAFQRTREPRYRDAALAAARQAVTLYPHHARERARFALISHLAGGHAEQASREAAMALELDRVTPHADQKLPEALRGELMPLVGGAN